ncbi:Phospholipase A2 domain,Phospholipase A2, histidine active site [Cinara cedri]|uniref:Phospholipase A2 n=1 Tax=Cinara cedri TaxID=506608 RepID=A0A5E4MUD2_9HEMI|nr:Phospholipase A2 domain,Phospholipase A2, histidine active site [Cinara cedri]
MKITFIVTLLFFVTSPNYGSFIIIDKLRKRALIITHKLPICRIYNNRNEIQKLLKENSLFVYESMSVESVDLFYKICRGALRGPCQNIDFIYPGTKWCGPGNVAKNYSDLGVYREEDICCREHDHCTRTLETGQCYFNLCNTSPYTRSHCECDKKFQKCLNKVNTSTAHTLGIIFFNIVKVMCFKEECLFGGCFQTFEIIPNYHPRGRSLEILSSDHLFNIFIKIFMDFVRYTLI